MDDEKLYWIGFSVFPGIGPLRFRLLLDYFGSARAAWRAPAEELRRIHLPVAILDRFLGFRRTFEPEEYLDRLAKLHVQTLTLREAKYPKLLKEISDAPFVLYVLGQRTKSPIDLERTIAVVGTRKVSRYGREVTEQLVGDLVAAGFTIVSGLAYGVDAIAHESAIAAGGKTIAVLGSGIDIIAPPSNARLYRQIAQGNGAIVSEMPLGMRPSKGLFPARNRIISGLSLGVLVTEGASDSGSLITARNAGAQGREVFAVPGPITSRLSAGPAKLLKNGAKLVESVEDILEELGMSNLTRRSSPVKPSGESQEEQKIIDCLEVERKQIDEIVRETDLTISVVAATLTILQIRGVVKDYGDKVYGLT